LNKKSALLIVMAASHAALAQDPVLARLLYQGTQLNPDQAAAIEQALTIIPDDSSSHIELISYYCTRVEMKSDAANSRANWGKHLFWLVDHHPESRAFDFPSTIYTIVRPTGGTVPSIELSNESRDHWEQAMAAHPQQKAVLAHAA
jgi:hypothetical protein